jgi:hypothetical protein
VGYASLAFAPKPGQGQKSTLKRGQEPDHDYDYDTTSQEHTNVGRMLIVYELNADTFAPVRQNTKSEKMAMTTA